jgi:hypothetical protein
MHTAYNTSVKPPRRNCSASFSVDTVIPLAPASAAVERPQCTSWS